MRSSEECKIHPSSIRGSSIVEAAITLPIFVAFLLFFIDICRYLIILIFINYAAHETVLFASKVEVETNTLDSACSPDPDPCLQYLRNLRRIIGTSPSSDNAKGRMLASLVAGAPTRESVARLIEFRHYDATQYGIAGSAPYFSYFATGDFRGVLGSDAEAVSTIGFLRPGERLVRLKSDGTPDGTIDHPSRPFLSSTPTSGTGWPGIPGTPDVGLTWETVLQNDPLAVIIEVDYSSIFGTLFIPRIRIQGAALAYRRTGTFGVGSGSAAFPTLTPTSTSTPTITATATETPDVPTATPTVVIIVDSPTPTLTVTPGPSVTATQTEVPTATPIPVDTDTPTVTPTEGSPTVTPSVTETGTATATPTPTETDSGGGG